MTRPSTSLFVSTLLALSMALSSAACSEDGGGQDRQQTEADTGAAADTSTPPQDAGDDTRSDDTGSGDAGDDDVADISDATGEEDVAPAATLADGIELVGVHAFQTIETKLLDGGAPSASEIPLIAGRETLFRVLVTPGPSWTTRNVTAQVVLIHGDTGTSQTFTDAFEVTQTSLPEQRSSVFEVRVPEGVITPQTSASFRLVGDGTLSVESSDQSAARWPRDDSTTPLEATDATGKLHVVLVPFKYDTDGSGRLPDTSPEQLDRFEGALRALYPAHELLVEVRQPISWNTSVDFGDFNRELRSLKQSDGADEAFYYGIIQPTETFEQYCSGTCTTGQSFTVSNASASSYRVGSGLGFSGERWAWTLVHEMGHMHGRGHAPCGVSWWSEDRSYPYGDGTVGIWGWDSRSDTLFEPDDVTDFMGYCDDLWASDYTYLGLVDRMTEANALQQTMSLTPKTTWRYINWSDDSEPSWGRTTRERDPDTGEWARATYLDGEGNALRQVQVPLIRYAHHGERSVLVPEAPENALRLQVDAASKVFVLQLP
jgi:hypothetical protein